MKIISQLKSLTRTSDGQQRRKSNLWALAIAALLTGPMGASAAPILHYEFDTPGNIQSSTGTASLNLTTFNDSNIATNHVGAAPKPLGGQTNALDFTAATSGSARATGLNSTNASFLTSNLGSFTIAAWVLGVDSGPNERIFRLTGGSNVAIDFNLNGSGAGSALVLSVGGSTPITSALDVRVPENNADWYFVAVTYDITSGAVTFYSGAEGGALASSSGTLLNGGIPYLPATNSTTLDIGNSSPTGGRRLNGYMGDLAFHGTALSSSEVYAEFAAIPEPATVTITLAGLAVLTLGGRMRRRMATRTS